MSQKQMFLTRPQGLWRMLRTAQYTCQKDPHGHMSCFSFPFSLLSSSEEKKKRKGMSPQQHCLGHQAPSLSNFSSDEEREISWQNLQEICLTTPFFSPISPEEEREEGMSSTGATFAQGCGLPLL